MHLNPDTEKKLNLKTTQYTEEKKYTEKENRKAAFERKLYPKGYCLTHGFPVTKRNTSQTCLVTAEDHQRAATRKNIMGGSEARK